MSILSEASSSRARWLVLLPVLLASAEVQAEDFTYITNNGTILITGYTGAGGAVVIPSSVSGLPVTGIGDWAFDALTSVTSVTLPNTVTSIGVATFNACSNLTGITIPDSVTNIEDGVYTKGGPIGTFSFCTSLTNMILGSRVAHLGLGAFRTCTSLTSVTIPNTVAGIGDSAFAFCTGLSKVTVGNSITNIEPYAFLSCSNLAGVYFQGNAPTAGSDIFTNANDAIVYYLPGTTGWSPTFGGRPAVLWNPQADTGDTDFGVGTAGFGFNITGTADIPIVVEGCTSLAAPSWVPLLSCTLTNGSVYFADSAWTKYAGRFYRIRSP
jgi:hypothetical protein